VGEPVPLLTVRVTARSSHPGVGPWRDGVLEVRVVRPATRGEATSAALAAVARALDVPRSTVRLVMGTRSRLKRVSVGSLTPAELSRRLDSLASDDP
jgi:uncharacterized protein YggU (UPF0235/DUF167 family)